MTQACPLLPAAVACATPGARWAVAFRVSARHTFHVDRRVVAPLAECVDACPELGARGQSALVDGIGLAPDVPRVGMQLARPGELFLCIPLVATLQQGLSETKARMRLDDASIRQTEMRP